MVITLALFASLAQYQPDGQGGRHARELALEDGTTIAALITQLGLPDEPRVIFVNGVHAEEARTLTQGARLAIFPPIAGG